MDTVSLRDHSLETFDTPTLLAHATEQSIKRKYEDFSIVDVDSHHYESDCFTQILDYIEDPVMRADAKHMGMRDGGITSSRGSYQEMAGRVTRYKGRAKEKTPEGPHRDITLTRRWMDAFGVDFTCLFPTPMLCLGPDARASRSRSRWRAPITAGSSTTSRRKSRASRRASICRSTRPTECERMIEELGEKPGVVGFCVTAPRYKGVWDNCYATHLRDARGARPAAGVPFGLHVGRRPDDGAVQPLHRRPRAGLHLVQRRPPHELDRQRHARALSQAQGAVDRERPGVAAVPDAAARQRVHDAQLRSAAPQEEAVGLYARHVLHDPADGDGGQRARRSSSPSRSSRPTRSSCTRRTIRTGTWICRARSTTCRSSTSSRSATSSAAMRCASSTSRTEVSDAKLARKAMRTAAQ